MLTSTTGQRRARLRAQQSAQQPQQLRSSLRLLKNGLIRRELEKEDEFNEKDEQEWIAVSIADDVQVLAPMWAMRKFLQI
jgi:hypothetical protein